MPVWTCLLALMLAATASASTVTGPACTPGSFSDYEGLPTGCSAGPIQFFGFALFAIDSGGLFTPSAAFLASISVSADWNPSTSRVTLVVGGFTPYYVGPGVTAGYEIRFTADPAPVLAGEDIELDPPFGTIAGTQSFCKDALFTSSTSCSDMTTPGTVPFSIGSPAYLNFAPPLFTLDTRTTILLNPFLDTASGFDGVIFTFDVVPEPGTWSLLLLGLAGAAARRRNRR